MTGLTENAPGVSIVRVPVIRTRSCCARKSELLRIPHRTPVPIYARTPVEAGRSGTSRKERSAVILLTRSLPVSSFSLARLLFRRPLLDDGLLRNARLRARRASVLARADGAGDSPSPCNLSVGCSVLRGWTVAEIRAVCRVS